VNWPELQPTVGEFLKELEMTEGRGTGIPKMLREIEKNNSPEPAFHTDDDRTFFLVEFPVHPVFTKVMKKEDVTGVTPQVTPEVTPEVEKMLAAITGEMTRGEIQKKLGLKDEKHFREYYQQVAVKLGLIEMTIPDKPRSRLQKYRLTATGEKLLKELKKGKRD
jgi:ATP-dependent DNA helicase RecG